MATLDIALFPGSRAQEPGNKATLDRYLYTSLQLPCKKHYYFVLKAIPFSFGSDSEDKSKDPVGAVLFYHKDHPWELEDTQKVYNKNMYLYCCYFIN